MADIFARLPVTDSEIPATALPHVQVTTDVLKVNVNSFELEFVSGSGLHPSVKILLDGRPMSGLIQRICIEISAETMIPVVHLDLVPGPADDSSPVPDLIVQE